MCSTIRTDYYITIIWIILLSIWRSRRADKLICDFLKFSYNTPKVREKFTLFIWHDEYLWVYPKLERQNGWKLLILSKQLMMFLSTCSELKFTKPSEGSAQKYMKLKTHCSEKTARLWRKQAGCKRTKLLLYLVERLKRCLLLVAFNLKSPHLVSDYIRFLDCSLIAKGPLG